MRLADKKNQRGYYCGMLDLSNVVARLNARRGECKRQSKALGIPYNTLLKIAKGATVNPKMDTINRLAPLMRKPRT